MLTHLRKHTVEYKYNSRQTQEMFILSGHKMKNESRLEAGICTH